MSVLTPDRWRAIEPFLDRAMDLDGGGARDVTRRSPPDEPGRRARPGGSARVAARSSRRSLPRRHPAAAARRHVARRPGGRRLHARSSPSGREAWEASGWRGAATGASKGASPSSFSTRASSAAPARSGSGARARSSRGWPIRNIARLLDAGVSPSGQPYIVLEHVDGETIDRLLRLPPARRRGAAAALPRRVRRRVPGARQSDRSPRHQALERARHRDGQVKLARLRDRQAPRGGLGQRRSPRRSRARAAGR